MKPKKMKALIKKLDKVFSEYIRRKFIDENGVVRCYTCGQPFIDWKKIQCGHFWSRRYYALRWDENNARPQDTKCNIFNQGCQEIFGTKLRREIGDIQYSILERKRHNKFKLEKFTLEILIKEYEQKLKHL